MTLEQREALAALQLRLCNVAAITGLLGQIGHRDPNVSSALDGVADTLRQISDQISAVATDGARVTSS